MNKPREIVMKFQEQLKPAFAGKHSKEVPLVRGAALSFLPPPNPNNVLNQVGQARNLVEKSLQLADESRPPALINSTISYCSNCSCANCTNQSILLDKDKGITNTSIVEVKKCLEKYIDAQFNVQRQQMMAFLNSTLSGMDLSNSSVSFQSTCNTVISNSNDQISPTDSASLQRLKHPEETITHKDQDQNQTKSPRVPVGSVQKNPFALPPPTALPPGGFKVQSGAKQYFQLSDSNDLPTERCESPTSTVTDSVSDVCSVAFNEKGNEDDPDLNLNMAHVPPSVEERSEENPKTVKRIPKITSDEGNIAGNHQAINQFNSRASSGSFDDFDDSNFRPVRRSKQRSFMIGSSFSCSSSDGGSTPPVQIKSLSVTLEKLPQKGKDISSVERVIKEPLAPKEKGKVLQDLNAMFKDKVHPSLIMNSKSLALCNVDNDNSNARSTRSGRTVKAPSKYWMVTDTDEAEERKRKHNVNPKTAKSQRPTKKEEEGRNVVSSTSDNNVEMTRPQKKRKVSEADLKEGLALLSDKCPVSSCRPTPENKNVSKRKNQANRTTRKRDTKNVISSSSAHSNKDDSEVVAVTLKEIQMKIGKSRLQKIRGSASPSRVEKSQRLLAKPKGRGGRGGKETVLTALVKPTAIASTSNVETAQRLPAQQKGKGRTAVAKRNPVSPRKLSGKAKRGKNTQKQSSKQKDNPSLNKTANDSMDQNFVCYFECGPTDSWSEACL